MGTIKKNLGFAYKKLQKNKISSAFLDAELLLSFVLRKSREYILAHPEKKLTKKQIIKFTDLIKQRVKHMPVAYLTNTKEFYGREFYVDKRVLVPRPETEMIIDVAKRATRNAQRVGDIIDVGTGSGCIIITLIKELQNLKSKIKKLKFTAIDISKDALIVARKNARLHNIDKKIKFLRGNLLEPFLKNKKLVIGYWSLVITCNLPYLTPTQVKNSISIKHEPKLALTAGKDGLKYYRELTEQINLLQKQNPQIKITLLCEIDPAQIKGIKKIFSFAKNIKIKKDLAGRDRIVVVKL
ncbi:MAG: peptide chain release factor N(5)-glutamine methyltransferase [Patescibacteria group bacterium]|jgi:release factor glutamine methyltransferase